MPWSSMYQILKLKLGPHDMRGTGGQGERVSEARETQREKRVSERRERERKRKRERETLQWKVNI